MYTYIIKRYNVDANLDASDNLSSANEPSSLFPYYLFTVMS